MADELDREGVEQLVARWDALPRPLMIGPDTATLLMAKAGGYFQCPPRVFLVVALRHDGT